MKLNLYVAFHLPQGSRAKTNSSVWQSLPAVCIVFLPPSLKVFVFPHLPPPSLLYKHIWLLTSMWLSTESYWVTRPQQKHVPQWELSSVMMVVTCDCEPMKRGTQWKRNTNKTFSGIHIFVFNSLNFIKWTCGSMYVTKCGLALYVTAIVVTRF